MITNDGQYRTTKTLLGQFEEQPETWRRPVRRTRSCTSCRLTLLVLRHAISRASRRVRALRSGARPTRSANCTLCWSEPVLSGDGRSAGSPPSLGSRSNRSSVTRRAGMRTGRLPLGAVRGPRRHQPKVPVSWRNCFAGCDFAAWGRYGLSAFYARSDDEVLDLGEDHES